MGRAPEGHGKKVEEAAGAFKADLLAHYRALAFKWAPTRDPDDPETMGLAVHLEEMYWEKLEVTINNAVAALYEE